jgi:UDP-glucuronate decarboxylase
MNNSKNLIIVTGGAGFIGSNLCKYLLTCANNHVICIDNLMTLDRKIDGDNILDEKINDIIDIIKFNNNFTFLNIDIIDKDKIDNNQKLNRFLLSDDYILTQIFHLACPASPPVYQKNPIHTIKTCTYGTINICELAIKYNARILFTSTSEVYGDPNISPQVESYNGNVNCVGPRSCYDEGKRIAETILFEYHNNNKLDVRIARIFNTYGIGMHPYDGRVITNFIEQAKNNENITIYGDGTQTRSFCYIDDQINGLDKLMNYIKDKTNTEDKDEFYYPINIGNNNEITINELANTIKELTNSNSTIIYKPLPKDDPKQRCPDITLANELLNWKPQITLKNGINRILYYNLNYNF